MDTLGNVIDKLFTVNLKIIYTDDMPKLDNLRMQNRSLKSEINALSSDIINGKVKKYDALRPQHKTY